jgi:hypothetical protein
MRTLRAKNLDQGDMRVSLAVFFVASIMFSSTSFVFLVLKEIDIENLLSLPLDVLIFGISCTFIPAVAGVAYSVYILKKILPFL